MSFSCFFGGISFSAGNALQEQHICKFYAKIFVPNSSTSA